MPRGRGFYTQPRGRAASPVRPGTFMRDWLLDKTEDHPSSIHRGYKAEFKFRGLKYKPATFPSFLRYLHALVQVGLLEFTGREEPMEFPGQMSIPPLLQLRDHTSPRVVTGVMRYYRITPQADLNDPAWSDVFGVLGQRVAVAAKLEEWV